MTKPRKETLTQTDLRKLFEYDPETGILIWRSRDSSMFKSAKRKSAEAVCKTWNTRYAGKKAFTATNSKGYLMGRIFGKGYLAHRVIWCMRIGEWPVNQIDHENHIKTDNRWVNLREADDSKNMHNLPMSRRNKSGCVGVLETGDVHTATITHQHKSYYLGTFLEKEEAIAARKAAEVKFGFHPNHGKPKHLMAP